MSKQPPEVTDLDIAFPTRFADLCPPWDQLSGDEQSNRCPFCRAVGLMFFKGGRLADFGITPKPGVDAQRVVRFIQATLGDYGPKHEHKIGGVAHMLKNWCIIEGSNP